LDCTLSKTKTICQYNLFGYAVLLLIRIATFRKIIELSFLQEKDSATAGLFPKGLSGMVLPDKGTVFVAVFLDITVFGESGAAGK
jgi:hypothetical protein